MSSSQYDSIGQAYATNRRADPRLAATIWTALDHSKSVVNVGAGAGSYEPLDRRVVAVEPSIVMLRQRPPSTATVVRATASHLPFSNETFDAAMAVLTVHHWVELEASLREVRRVTRDRIVIVTWNPASGGSWLFHYFPELLAYDRTVFPALEVVAAILAAPLTVTPWLLPQQCSDGFTGAFWDRPEVYLDANRRRSMSSLRAVKNIDEGLRRLKADLDSGKWESDYGHVRRYKRYDAGYVVVTAQLRHD